MSFPKPDSMRVCVIGPRSFQTEMVAYYLESETGLICMTAKSASEAVTGCHEKDPDRRLLVIDCQGCEGMDEKLQEVLPLLDNGRISGERLIFFNVPTDFACDDAVEDHGIRMFNTERTVSHLLKGVMDTYLDLLRSRGELPEDVSSENNNEQTGREKLMALTPRELEILGLVAAGHKNEAIAEILYISLSTVKTHVYSIFKKIGVANRLQAALWAAKYL